MEKTIDVVCSEFERLAKPWNWSLFYRRAFMLSLPVSFPVWILTVSLLAILIMLVLMPAFIVAACVQIMWERRS